MLDGLRSVAAIMVMIFHRRFWFNANWVHYGYLAVDFFFLLSGFVIGYAYDDRLRSGAMRFSGFLKTRIIRLGPLAALGAVLGGAVNLAATLRDGGNPWPIIAGLPLAMATLPVPWLHKPFNINDPSWSLFFEIAANLVFARFAMRLGNRRLVIALIVAMLALTLIVVTSAKDHFNTVGLLWGTMLPAIPRVAAPFLGGLVLHRLWALGKLPKLTMPFSALAMAVAVLLVMPSLPYVAELSYILLCDFVLFPLLIIIGCQSQLSGRSAQVARLSAAISFPVYILHLPILTAFDLVRGETPSHTRISFVAEAVFIILFAWAAGRYFDAPVRRWLGNRFPVAPAR